MSRGARAAAGGILLAALAVTAAAQAPIGPEFQINADTAATYWARQASVAAGADGAFVVAWQSLGQDGDGEGVFARRFAPDATPLDAQEFQVNSTTTSNQRYPQVSRAADGAFVVVWQDRVGYGSFQRARARRYDAAGVPLDALETTLGSSATAHQRFPAVASVPGGPFVAAWQSFADPPTQWDLLAQVHSASGTALTAEVPVDPDPLLSQFSVAVAANAAGGFVVVWHGQGREVMGRRFDAAGTPQGPAFVVNTYTDADQGYPAIGMAPDGRFVVAWESLFQDGSFEGVFARMFAADGTPLSGEFPVNSYTTLAQGAPAVAVGPGGDFFIVWQSYDQDGWSYGVFGQMFEASGARLGGEIPVYASDESRDEYPSVASDNRGTFVVAWEGLGMYRRGVFGRRFGPDLIFKDGFESGGLSAWSAAATDGGDAGTSPTAALRGSAVGMYGLADDTAGLYVQDDSPASEYRYRARFHFDPNGFDPGEASGARRTRIFIAFSEEPSRRAFALVLKRQAGSYSLMARARLDDGTQVDTAFVPITDAPHAVEVEWRRSSGPDAVDGELRLAVDGAWLATLAGLDNSVRGIDFVRLGALSVKAGASGSMYWDEFESRRETAIGP